MQLAGTCAGTHTRSRQQQQYIYSLLVKRVCFSSPFYPPYIVLYPTATMFAWIASSVTFVVTPVAM